MKHDCERKRVNCICTCIELERVQLLSELSNYGNLGIIKSVTGARFSKSKTWIVELEFRLKRQCRLKFKHEGKILQFNIKLMTFEKINILASSRRSSSAGILYLAERERFNRDRVYL